MGDLTFGEQVKIVLGRKGITIKQLAEMIEETTGKKMSRQNLTQRLGRDNFQEQDMRMIAEILGCPFRLSILEGQTSAAEHTRAEAQRAAEQLAAAEARRKEEERRAQEQLRLAMEEEQKMFEEARKQEEEKAAAEAARREEERKLMEEEAAAREAEEKRLAEEGLMYEMGKNEDVDITIGELYDIHKKLEETGKEEAVEDVIKKEMEKPKKERFGFFRKKQKNRPEEELEEEAIMTEQSEPVIVHKDAEENLEIGEMNPYTRKEYQSNSVRMHPTRIGYVQVYDRTIHKWTDMTEWAFLGYQERKKALLGKAYEPPIYLD